MPENKSRGLWDASDCALVLIDYQQNVFESIVDRDPRVVELNVCTLARAALDFNVPVVASMNGPMIPSLKEELCQVMPIDRTSVHAWDDPTFVRAVKATGRKKLVMAGLETSVAGYSAIHALAAGYEVSFIEDAAGGHDKRRHETAILQLIHAGAIPNTTLAVISEWFRDFKPPLSDSARKIFVRYFAELALLKRSHEQSSPKVATDANWDR
jgi:nicotinamidase-related amidase